VKVFNLQTENTEQRFPLTAGDFYKVYIKVSIGELSTGRYFTIDTGENTVSLLALEMSRYYSKLRHSLRQIFSRNLVDTTLL